ncbi:hypothetical protein SAMN05660776_2928 [Salegentibacter holothuriorum]|uniref:Uncharacterized protein n=1 Tax=Salegentibacter holothuriorum TaxID=241145 RepID=A0A1T5E069_9FLAO|nr:hypothetical protein SAMN05660776_2928 [Salegentibacter holothuriorum]
MPFSSRRGLANIQFLISIKQIKKWLSSKLRLIIIGELPAKIMILIVFHLFCVLNRDKTAKGSYKPFLDLIDLGKNQIIK